jgi:GNAT superfamily N-acetyltransferase
MIRPAVIEDVPSIAEMIRELAEYEHLSREAVLDENLLREHLFGARPYAEVLVALEKGATVGFALFFHNYSTFLGRPGIYLEDLFVRPAFRKQGHGKALLKQVAKLALQRGCGRLEWSVLDWNAPSIEFYRSLRARAMDQWTIYRMTGEELKLLGKPTE